MSEHIEVTAMGSENTYTITCIGDCRIVYGSVPMIDMGKMLQSAPKGAVMDMTLAGKLGASLVFGSPEGLAELRLRDLPLSASRQQEITAAREKRLPQSVLDWLENGDRGESSEALCHHLFGVFANKRLSHPHDPADLRRCVQFLEATQSGHLIAHMASVSPEWARLVSCWPALMETYASESADGARADRTYAMMRAALND